MNVATHLSKLSISKYFILDSHDQGKSGQNGVIYQDEDYIQYSYEPSQNNKLSVGSGFLYRKPGKSFKIVGGGVIESISETDSNGYKTAYIGHGFVLSNPLSKGDAFLENFPWKNKSKLTVGWRGFFTNYGILQIDHDDFWGLVGSAGCIPTIGSSIQSQSAMEDQALIEDINDSVILPDSPKVINHAPKAKGEPKAAHSKLFPRDKTVALNAMRNANHTCEINSEHPTFLRRKTAIPYVEPHHLIPMCFQSEFENSLDVEENIVALCSNCHNRIHYGSDAADLILKLWHERKDGLERVGIIIDEQTLLALYNL